MVAPLYVLHMSEAERELRERIAKLELENARLERYIDELRAAIKALVSPPPRPYSADRSAKGID